MKNTFDRICAWLFGESKWEQKKKLKRLLWVTAILSALTIISMFADGIGYAAWMVAIILLVWGWGFVRAMATTAAKIVAFIDNDLVLIIITIILWLFLGVIGGILALVLGIIRSIQLREE